MNTTDKGIRTALAHSQRPRLSSNFTYRTLQRIEAEQRRREALMEKRMYAAMIATCCLMIGGLAFAGYWFYEDALWNRLQRLVQLLPDKENCVFAIPTLVALPLLWLFNRLLKRKFSSPEHR